MDEVEEIKQKVRDLRDSDFNECPAHEDDTQECACGKYDEIIDLLDEL